MNLRTSPHNITPTLICKERLSLFPSRVTPSSTSANVDIFEQRLIKKQFFFRIKLDISFFRCYSIYYLILVILAPLKMKEQGRLSQ